jgi:hypothetical protein
MSKLLQLSVEDYINETKAALSTQGGASHFTYLVEDGKFMWKKLDQCSKNIKMKYGCIELAEVRPNMHIASTERGSNTGTPSSHLFRRLLIMITFINSKCSGLDVPEGNTAVGIEEKASSSISPSSC